MKKVIAIFSIVLINLSLFSFKAEAATISGQRGPEVEIGQRGPIYRDVLWARNYKTGEKYYETYCVPVGYHLKPLEPVKIGEWILYTYEEVKN
ncbi:hypothetical protein SAMN02745248_01703 [Hathewaya proteolytica DSM 3090]|uniref:Uncharacterized protein n=1 Tax=Hathewaya proteolytica DSM 3090 TaxID=1121331 RepID=A0A1M6PHI5_9CLOT|nr:hypothetical protein [Hathewaya proteolytica]SHK07406.1 hypothetical protein SAMN02745248_01703 [Hathewaya proteolytica DSM 3090]